MQIQNELNLIERKWGYFLQFTENEYSTIKILHIKKHSSTSYQYHNLRSEQWYVIKGKVSATKGILSEILLPSQTITIEKQEKHKLEALEDSIVLEISKGFFDEADIVRV